jgi:chemotaxis signal transduction protein
MTTMVCFTTGGTPYCIPVGVTRAVRDVKGMVGLPASLPDVAGIVPGDPPLTVISPLGNGGGNILVVESNGKIFGLLVDAVTGLRRIDEGDIKLAPHGQGRSLISGTVDTDGTLTLVTDPHGLASQL